MSRNPRLLDVTLKKKPSMSENRIPIFLIFLLLILAPVHVTQLMFQAVTLSAKRFLPA